MLRLPHVFALLVATAAVAHAQPDHRAQAFKLFEDSDKAYKAGKFEKAADLLRRAYQLYPEPTLLYNLGRALEGLGDTQGAIDEYEKYLSEAKQVEDRAAIERRIATLKQMLADQNKPPPPPPPPIVIEKPVPVAAPLRDELDVQATAGWVTIGTGGALIAAGALFGIRANGNHDDAVKDPVQLNAQHLQQAAERDATIANVLFGIGAAVTIGGGVWEVLHWRDEQSSEREARRVRVSPTSIAVEWTW